MKHYFPIVFIFFAGYVKYVQASDTMVDPYALNDWVADFDHLEPSLWAGYQPRNGEGYTLMQFRQPFSGFGSTPEFGWEIYECRDNVHLMILHDTDGLLAEVEIMNTDFVDRIYRFWINQLVATRYPDLQQDENVGGSSADGFLAEFVGFARGLGDLYGHAYSRLDNSGPGVMTRLSFALYKAAREGVINDDEKITEILGILEDIR